LLKEQLLLEGRKENAMRALVRKLSDEKIIKHMENRVFPSILEKDPTENKKYIEWMARIVNRGVLRTIARLTQDPSEDMDTAVIRYTGQVMSIIERNLRDYHKLAQRNLIEKNIDSFKDLGDWESKIYNAKREFEHREKMKEYEQEAKDSSAILHDDEDIFIVRPLSKESSCYYGQGVRWCISATKSRNYFDQYTGEGVGFYFVLFKHLPADHDNKQMALTFHKGDYEEPTEVFDSPNDDVGVEGVREAVESNLIAKQLKKGLANTLKRMKGDKKQEFFRQKFDELTESFDEYKNEYLEDDYEVPEELQGVLKSMDSYDSDYGFVDPDDRTGIFDDLEESINETYNEVIGQAAQHFDVNPAGPTEEDYDDLYNNYNFENFYVSYEEMDENKFYWNAGVSWEIGDEDIEFLNEDEDEIRTIVAQVMDNNHIYTDDYDLETYGGSMTFRADFSPAYDEGEGLEGFERFLDRISEYDGSWQTVIDESIEEFREANLIGGGSMSALYDRFEDMNLEHFEVDIEQDELSISQNFEFSIPIPQYMYALATKDKPSWQQKVSIKNVPQLMNYNNAIREREQEHRDLFIDDVTKVFNQIFKLYAAQMQSSLPGFGQEPGSIEEVGLVLPDTRISIYRQVMEPTLGSSGIIADFFFDIRLDISDAEDEDILLTIERFLRKVDSDSMSKKLQARYENIVVNDVVKNVLPKFEQPEQQQVAENKKRKLKILIKEFQGRGGITGGGFGGMSPGLAGMMGANRGTSMDSHPADSGELPDDDSPHVAKAVLVRNSHVLLLKSKDGRWDLPGGHLKRGEGSVPALSREVFEETGLSIDTSQLKQINGSTGTTRFYMGTYPHDDIVLSDEHVGHEFVSLQSIPELEGLDNTYKQMIMKYDNINESKNKKKLKLLIG